MRPQVRRRQARAAGGRAALPVRVGAEPALHRPAPALPAAERAAGSRCIVMAPREKRSGVRELGAAAVGLRVRAAFGDRRALHALIPRD